MTFHLPMLTSAYPDGVCFSHLLRLSSPNNGPGKWMRLGRLLESVVVTRRHAMPTLSCFGFKTRGSVHGALTLEKRRDGVGLM